LIEAAAPNVNSVKPPQSSYDAQFHGRPVGKIIYAAVSYIIACMVFNTMKTGTIPMLLLLCLSF
jgi:hypothetical protein